MDEGAPLGVATTRSMERVAAAVGLLREAPIEFEPVADVPLGVDLQPDLDAKTLNVRLHRLSTATHDAVLLHLFEELTATETHFPGTDLRLVFSPLGPV